MPPLTITTARTARYHLLGEAGPAIRHIWFCLAAHGQPPLELAAQLADLAAPEQLLVLPEGLSRFEVVPPDAPAAPGEAALASRTAAVWFAPDSLLADLADLTQYLDRLAEQVLASCPPDTPVTVLGGGHGAAAACRWLAGGRVSYERLLLYDAVFPLEIDRRATLVALPEQPILVVSSDAGPDAAAACQDLLQDCLDVGLPARLVQVAAGPLSREALTAAGETYPHESVPNPTE